MEAAAGFEPKLTLEKASVFGWVSEVLGHSDPSITLRTYAHALPAGDDELDFVPLVGAHANRKTAPHALHKILELYGEIGARDRDRTGDPQLGKAKKTQEVTASCAQGSASDCNAMQ